MANVCFLARQPPVGPGPAHSRGFYITHDTPQSVGLLWTGNQVVAETSTWQHTTLTINIHALGGIRTHNLSRRAAADPRRWTARPLGQAWQMLLNIICVMWINRQMYNVLVLIRVMSLYVCNADCWRNACTYVRILHRSLGTDSWYCTLPEIELRISYYSVQPKVSPPGIYRG